RDHNPAEWPANEGAAQNQDGCAGRLGRRKSSPRCFLWGESSTRPVASVILVVDIWRPDPNLQVNLPPPVYSKPPMASVSAYLTPFAIGDTWRPISTRSDFCLQ